MFRMSLGRGMLWLSPVYVGLALKATVDMLDTRRRDNLTTTNSQRLAHFVLKAAHIAIAMFQLTYLFLFDARYDLLLIASNFVVTLHWLFLRNECIMSYLERKVLEPDYVLGSDPYAEQDKGAGGPVAFAAVRTAVLLTNVIVILRCAAVPPWLKTVLIILAMILEAPVILRRISPCQSWTARM